MSTYQLAYYASIQRGAQKVGIFLISLLALLMFGLCLGAAFNLLPWLQISAAFGDTSIPNMGMILQIGFTLFCVALVFFIPANGRMMKLEASHRNFRVTMADVTQAYRASHEADRRGLFKIGSEFDSVRERIAHMREHPDLTGLENGIMEIAAQMSRESRGLASVYSDEKVSRARTFLTQRQEEVVKFQDQIIQAKLTIDDLKKWLLQIETEEGLIERQLDKLEAELFEILPELGFDLEYPKEKNVVPLKATPQKPKQTTKMISAKPAK